MPRSDEEAKTFTIEDINGRHLIWRNFAGREKMYNTAGDRNFAVVLDEETAQQMLKDGWPVKWQKPDEEDVPGDPFLPVTVKFNKYPPRVVMLTSRARTTLDEDSVEVLDWANIEKADLIIRGNHWFVNGKDGWKAYVKTLVVTIEEDYLERKYDLNGTDQQQEEK
jgi:hypothetical protein